MTGIDKRPIDGPALVRALGAKQGGLGSGLVGDAVCDRRNHGGDEQAVSAYAREDLDAWAAELGRPLASSCFGENLTTSGLDVTGARIGERWRIGASTVLEVSCPRIPCRTFAGWLGDVGWIKRFVAAAIPGAYLRVVEPGALSSGDPIAVVFRPAHAPPVRVERRGVVRSGPRPIMARPRRLTCQPFGRRVRRADSDPSPRSDRSFCAQPGRGTWGHIGCRRR